MTRVRRGGVRPNGPRQPLSAITESAVMQNMDRPAPKFRHADVAQLVERRLPKPKVASSSLVVRFEKTSNRAVWIVAELSNLRTCPQYVPGSAPGPPWGTEYEVRVQSMRSNGVIPPVRKRRRASGPVDDRQRRLSAPLMRRSVGASRSVGPVAFSPPRTRCSPSPRDERRP